MLTQDTGILSAFFIHQKKQSDELEKFSILRSTSWWCWKVCLWQDTGILGVYGVRQHWREASNHSFLGTQTKESEEVLLAGQGDPGCADLLSSVAVVALAKSLFLPVTLSLHVQSERKLSRICIPRGFRTKIHHIANVAASQL